MFVKKKLGKENKNPVIFSALEGALYRASLD
jgi:hypothetical protein